MPDERQSTPPFGPPYAANVQATFEQSGSTLAQPVGSDKDRAEAHYKNGSELREARRFDEALAAFTAAVTLKPDHAEAHNSRGIVLANLDRFEEALASFNAAIAHKPNYAEAYNNRGLILHDVGRLDDALASLDEAIMLMPENARAQSNRGVVLRDLGRVAEALASFDKAIALKADYAEAFYNRGLVLEDLHRFDDAVASLEKAIALRGDYFEAYNNLGIVLQDLRRPEDAIVAFDKAIAIVGEYPETRFNQAYCYLQLGRFEQGWRLHEWRKRLARPIADRFSAQPLWLGREDIASRTVFVHWEQGFGDTIQFCRYAKLLQARGAHVVMSVQGSLHRLLSQMSPDVQVISDSEPLPSFDYHCPMMSLPLAFGTTVQTIPSLPRYIAADNRKLKAWGSRLQSRTKPRIGIAWSGNAQQKNDRNRSIDLRTLVPLLSADAQWISLQKDARPGDAAALQVLPQLGSYAHELGDFSETAALIEHLDLVITVDTAVAHLAGAMGKPVWILLAANSDWRWLMDRDDSPWYPSARLFRQTEPGSWEDVVGRVRVASEQFIHSL